METSTLREKLHDFIDAADNKKLEAICTVLELDDENDYIYSQEEIEEFHTRRNTHLKEESKSYSVEEVMH